MSAHGLEAFLVGLYTDARARHEFLADPRAAATRAGLDPAEVAALEAIDRPGLELAARSFEAKRARQAVGRSAVRCWLGALSALAARPRRPRSPGPADRSAS